MISKPTPCSRTRLIVAAVASCFATGASALPVAPSIVHGTAGFAQSGNVLNVTNSNGAIINWQSFNIAAGETTRFIQPSASSAVLNRVLVADPSVLYGSLSSNGRVFLVNPSGILIGAGARIDTAGFVASALPLRNEDFLAGKLSFGVPGNATSGSVSNQGSITTPQGGSVYLISAATVENKGLIKTPGGETLLAAGQTVQIIDTATPGVTVNVTGNGTSTNLGTILANAGRIGIVGALVRNSGTLNASSLVREGGRIFLHASKDAYVDQAGRIVTTGTTGGQVEVLGQRVAVTDHARIDASGTRGGGSVLIGGDYQGKNPNIENATITYFGKDASVKVNATDTGNGGKLIVWSDDTTRAYGRIEAKGGAKGGNGGLVEISGKGSLDFHAQVDTLAPKGQAGTLLLDPADVTISTSPTTPGTFSGGVFSSGSSGSSTLAWSDITSQLSTGNVIITTSSSGTPSSGGSITFASSSSYTYSSTHSLSLLAHNNITVAGDLTNNAAGNLFLMAGWDGVSTSAPAVSSGAVPGGNIQIGANVTTVGSIDALAYGGIMVTPAGTSGASLTSGGASSHLNLTARDISVTATTLGGSASIFLQGGGTENITASNSITLTGGNGSSYLAAQITAGTNSTNATQNISAHTMTLNGGAQSGGGQLDYAWITDYGVQTVTVTGSNGSLTLNGGGTAGSGAAGDYAMILQRSITGGSQTITFQGANGSLQLTGGSGDGITSNPVNPICVAAGLNCTGSENFAAIGNTFGSQVVNFLASGGAIAIQGGNNGSFNVAGIGQAAAAQQTILGGPSITMTGGASGGSVTISGSPFYQSNAASITANFVTSTTHQQIHASTITLNGMGNATTYGGASISSPYQDIFTTGDVTLTGGSGDNGTSNGVVMTAATIGSDLFLGTYTPAVANTTLTVGGNLVLQSGTGRSSGAVIGSLNSTANVTANVAGNITVTGGPGSSGGNVYAGFGSINGYGGNVSVTAGGNISLNTNSILTGTGSVSGTTALTVLAAGNLNIGGTNVNAHGGNVSLMSGWNGNLVTPAVATTGVAGGALTIGTGITMAGNILAQAYGGLSLGAMLQSNGTGPTAIVLVAGGSFTNSVGASVLSTPSGSWQVWSGTNPTGDTAGGLHYSFKQYNAVHGSTPIVAAANTLLAADSGTGYGGLFYTGQPTVSGTLSGSVTKVYDGTTAATINLASISPLTDSNGDTVTVTAAGGAFDTKDVGTSKTVTLANVTINGTDGGPTGVPIYGLQAPTVYGAVGTITPLAISNAGVFASNKVYDTTTSATLGGTPTGVLAGDTATFTGTGTFAGKNVGNGVAVTASTLTLSGANAGDYSLPVSLPTGLAANITPATLTVTGETANNKVYDRTTAATFYGGSLVGILGSDSVTLTQAGVFASKNVGTGVVVTGADSLGGADSGNYMLTQSTGLSANITPLTISNTGIIAKSKVYDATTTATLGGSPTGILTGDAVSFAGAGTFADKKVGSAKAVTVTVQPTLAGADAADYSLTPGLPIGLTANISPAAVTVSGISASNKVYDGTTAATVSGGALSGVFGSDAVFAFGGSGSFADKNVGVAKSVTVSGIGLAGADAGNYVFGGVSDNVVADITPAALTISGLVANNKVYDGNTIATLSGGTFTGKISGDSVSFSGSGTFASKNVGTAIPVTASAGGSLSGADAGNYIIGGVQASGLAANITQLASVSWTGAASGLWSDPNNWAGGAVPDHANVASVVIPGSVAVTYDAGVDGGNTTLASLSSLGALTVQAGNLTINSGLTANGYTQTGGALSATSGKLGAMKLSAGSLTLTGSLTATGYSQTGGSVTAASVTLTSVAAISQTGGALTTPRLTATAVGGMLLNGANQIGTVQAANSGSGDIGLINTSNPLTLTGLTNTGGSITVNNTGAITTTGLISASGSVTLVAHSPLTIGTPGIQAGGPISLSAGGGVAGASDVLTVNGPVSTTGAGAGVNLFAGLDLFQNANVSTYGGPVTAIASAGAITMAANASTSTSGGAITYDAVKNIVLGLLNAGATGSITVKSTTGSIGTAVGAPKPNVFGKHLDFSTTANQPIDISVPAPPAHGQSPSKVADSVVDQITSTLTNTERTATSTAQGGLIPAMITISSTPSLTATSTDQTTGGRSGTFGGSDTDSGLSNNDKDKNKDKDGQKTRSSGDATEPPKPGSCAS